MDTTVQDRLEIRELLEQWVVARDAAQWERFAEVWHDDGYMMATWFQGPATEFIEVSRRGFEKGVNILHFLGGSVIDVNGARAVAQTKMEILQRAPVHGVEADVTCIGRFHDFLEQREGRWGIVLRRLTYEKDWIRPIDPTAELHLDPAVLRRFPVGYRHLGYLQSQLGFDVHTDMPGVAGPGTERLYELQRAWLAGDPLGRDDLAVAL